MTKKAALVPLDRIEAHPTNIRRNLGDLRALAASIAHDGVLVPILLEQRGTKLQLRDGHRRVAAARIANLGRIPAIIDTVELPPAEWVRHAVTVNGQRLHQDPAERRDTIRRMRTLGLTFRQIADAYGVSTQTAANWAGYDDKPTTPDPTPTQPAAPKQIGTKRLRQFIDTHREQAHTLTATDILNALDHLCTGRADQ